MTDVTALLGFARRDHEAPGPDDVAVPGYPDNRIAPTPCVVRDARKADVSLDAEGFAIASHRSAYAGERDRKALEQGYHREMEQFLRDYLGAARVVASPGALLVRYGARMVGRHVHDGRIDVIDDRIPASFAHVDYLPDLVPEIAAYERRATGIGDLDYARTMIIQTWRAVSEPPQDVPLALCDRRTLADTDISVSKGILSPENAEGFGEDTFYIGKIHHSPAQDWFYFPWMAPDEVMIFTGYDNANTNAWKVAHTAFDNRHTDPAAKPRESIEARFYAYF